MHSRGVTLVELVATLAVLAIITALAAPNMGRWLETQQATTAHNALLGSLHLARAHAVTSGQRTVVCKRDRKSTRLNSSHVAISYAVFCLKKKKKKKTEKAQGTK